MIAVLADDFTGAAEIAGLGWRHGLRAEIFHRDAPAPAAATAPDLLVFDSDSRNCAPAEARRRAARLLRRAQKLRPAWIYKKVDSVLRGHVRAEIEAALAALGARRCLLVPANPGVGRVIRGGEYFVHGVPLDRTGFRHDPRHPRTTARVAALLGAGGRKFPLQVLPPGSAPPAGITVGEAARPADAARWARAATGGVFPAGGAEFFAALLRARGVKPRAQKMDFLPPGPHLFVCGSQAGAAREFLARSEAQGWPVLQLPAALRAARPPAAAARARWASEIATALRQHPRVIAAIGGPLQPGRQTPARLGRRLTDAVARALALAPVAAVCVEGGATTAALLQRLRWRRLAVAGEFSTGVTALRPAAARAPLLICKPGSYEWTGELLK